MASELEFVSFAEFVENLPARTVAKSSDKNVVSNPTDGPGSETNAVQAQKILAGNIAQGFDATRTSESKYKAREKVVYEGELYIFLRDHYGAWSASDVQKLDVQQELSDLEKKNVGLESIVNGKVNVYDYDAVWSDQLLIKNKIGSLYAEKQVSVLLSCNNPPASKVNLYFSTATDSSTIISTNEITVNQPFAITVPAAANYVWIFKNESSFPEKPVNLSFCVDGGADGLVKKVDDLDGDISAMQGDLSVLKTSLRNMSVSYKSSGLSITKKMSDGNISIISFAKFGANNILQLRSVAIFDADGVVLSSKNTATDSVGPFQVSADNNADGDNLADPKFTSGCHGYNGDQTGSATASAAFEVFADGELKSPSTFLCKHLKIIVANKIQGWNTRKSDGTGREILQEVVRYAIDSDFDKVKVYNNISPLEDVTISLYYGMQIAFARDFVEFNSEKKSEWLAKNTNSSYVGDKLDSVDGKGSDGFVQSMSVNSKGLGHFYYVPENLAKAFQSDKIYYNLIRQDLGLSVGESVFFDADYAFKFVGEKIESLKAGSYLIDNERVDKYFSIEDLPAGTYKLKLYYSGISPLSYANVYLASSHSGSGIITTFSNVANGTELTITVTSQTKVIWIFSNTVITGRIDYLIYS